MKAQPGDVVALTCGAEAEYGSRFDGDLGLVLERGSLYHLVRAWSFEGIERDFLFSDEEMTKIGEL